VGGTENGSADSYFSLEREAKNTVRYSEQTDGKPPAAGTIYVQKGAMGQDPPKTLVITVMAMNLTSHLKNKRR
jgi:hypothetical protein